MRAGFDKQRREIIYVEIWLDYYMEEQTYYIAKYGMGEQEAGWRKHLQTIQEYDYWSRLKKPLILMK